MALRIRLTSPMGLEVNGNMHCAAQLGRPQVRIALAVLVKERRRAVPRYEMAEVLWQGGLPAAWESALRGVVSKVRTVFVSAGLPPDVLTAAFGCYQLHLPPDTLVDIEAADGALKDAKSALANQAWDKACDAAHLALQVLERPFLPAENNERAAQWRTELRALELRALEALSDGHLGRGDVSFAVDAAEAALALEPYRESAYRRLMAAHAAAGSRGEALRAYDRCRSFLAEQLGVSPSSETEAQYVTLLGYEPEHPPPEAPVADGPRGAELAGVPSWPALPPIIVGRDQERAALGEAWRLAQCGQRQLVLLAGEAGIGKTVAALELASASSGAGAICLYGRCDRAAWTVYQPFVEALGRYTASCSLDVSHPFAGDLSRLRSMLRLPDARSGPVGTIHSYGDRHGLFTAAASVLWALATSRPVILIVDDLQWADRGSLLLLRHLVRGLPTSRLLIVAAFRPEEIEGNRLSAEILADLEREPAARRVHISCLDPAAGRDLAQHMTTPRCAPPVVDRLLYESGGNPFLLSQLLESVASSTCGPEGHTAIPPAIATLVTRRRSKLDGRANCLLNLCAVIGADIPLRVLHEAAGVEMDALLDALEDVASAGLVEEGHAGFRFRHPILWKAVYEQIAPSRRAVLHARVGEAIERCIPLTPPSSLPDLAHHFLAGASVGSVSSREPPRSSG